MEARALVDARMDEEFAAKTAAYMEFLRKSKKTRAKL